MFEEHVEMEGSLSSRISKASATVEWLSANFDGTDLRDTVYVTANPQLERNRESWEISLHEVINVWLDDGWDEETGTVLAETLTRAAIDAHKRFPNKRVVVHYMQPHYPFVPSNTSIDKDHLREIDGEGGSPEGENIWGKKFNGQLSLSRDRIWEMYTDNLEYVLRSVEDLIAEISGKVVITSDHGNYVGERASPIPIQEYGHPRGLYEQVLTRVPWFEPPVNERREIHIGSTTEFDEDVNQKKVDDRLSDLGYI